MGEEEKNEILKCKMWKHQIFKYKIVKTQSCDQIKFFKYKNAKLHILKFTKLGQYQILKM